MAKGITCTCGHSWNKSTSSKKDMNVCHICGKDNTMKDGGWLDKFQPGGNVAVSDATRTKYTKNTGLKKGVDQPILNMLDITLGAPQKQLVKMVTGKEQYPSEAMGIENPWGVFAADAILDPTNLVGAGLLGKAAKASGKLSKASKIAKAASKGEDAIKLTRAAVPNPLALLDQFTPRLDPVKAMGVEMDIMDLSPLNFIPGYGKKLSGKNQTFRKFGNSLDDVIQRQALSPAGGSDVFRMGKDQIVSEGNWAARNQPSENYPGVFEATFDMNNPNANLSALQVPDRNGVLMVDRAGRRLPEIPLTEPGMSFNRRLPFSTRYVPIDKTKLMNNQFQLATQLPHLQSLVEKYGLAVGGAGAYGYFRGGEEGAKEKIDLINQYTVDPVLDVFKGGIDKATELLPKKKNGGWLDKYNDGGPVQPNYNDASVSMSDDFVGNGYSNVGRNYSPAWGGQFQDGGFLQPNSYKLPQGIKVPYADPSSELAMSIGGEDGEPAYLIPSFKYGQPLKNPMAEYMLTGEHLGGPFKTWQDAEKFGELRHQYVEKGQTLPSPIATSNMAMGGSMPGAVGFTYARTINPAPSNGPYAKKTMASAQNGTEMAFYQNGLDWKPKSISKNGSNIIKDDMGQWNHPGEVTEIGSNQITMQGVPYPVLGISDTGDTQMMYPNQEYQYKGSSVTEYPVAQNGVLTSLYAGKNPKTFGKNVAAAQSTGVNKTLVADPTKLKKISQADLDAKEAAERRNRINVANAAQDMQFSSPENFAVATSAIADKLRFSDSPNIFDDNFFNPIPMIGHGASALGRVPLNVQQGNYGQAALDIATPIAFGAVDTIISPYVEKYVINPATKAVGEGINYALRNTSKYNNLNEIGRHVLGGVPPERSLDRLAGDELRHARIINELGNKTSTGVPLSDRVAYAVREGLPQEKLEQVFPHLRNPTNNIPGLTVEPIAPPVPPVPSVVRNTNATPTFETLSPYEQAQLIRNPELARTRGIEVPPQVQNPAPTFGTPNPELARLRAQALTPEIEDAAMSMPEDIANRGDMDEMMAWMANNNRSIRSIDDLATRGDAGYEYVDPFDTDAFDPAYPEMYEPIDSTEPAQLGRLALDADGNIITESAEVASAISQRIRQQLDDAVASLNNPVNAREAARRGLPWPPVEQNPVVPEVPNAEYTRLSDEAIAANQAFTSQRLASDNERLTDAATAFMLEHNANVANPGSIGSDRFPRSWGPAGGIDHNSFMDFYNNSGLTLREIAGGAANTGNDYLQGRYRLYAQDILDPAASSVQDMLNAPFTPSMPLESINLNANPSPFDLNIRGNGNLNKNTVSSIGNSRQMGDPFPKTMEDIIPPISEIPQILNNRFANKFQEYPLYQGPVDENLGYLTMGSAGSKKQVANRIENAIQNASESGKVYTGSTSTSHNSYLTQLKQQFKMSKEAGNAYDPQFLGYKYMNDMGNLSNAGYTKKEISAFLNTEIDQQIKRGVIPKNIQRPYVKGRDVMLPHYGLKKNEYGGTLEYFEQGGQLTKLDQLTNFTNYNTKQPGGWLDKYQ